MKKYKDIKELKSDLYQRTIWDDIRYYGFYIWWNWITDLKWKVPNCLERAYYGIGHADVWNFDYYLSTVIIRGLKQLKKYNHGCPTNIYDKYKNQIGLSQKEIDRLAHNEWLLVLSIMIEGFESAEKIICPSKLNIKKYKELEIKLNKGMDLFKKYYLSLWD